MQSVHSMTAMAPLSPESAMALWWLERRRALAQRITVLEEQLSEQIQSLGLQESAWQRTERELAAAQNALAWLPMDRLG
jgi:hypothetical protein